MTDVPGSLHGIYIPPQRIGFRTLSSDDYDLYEAVASEALELLGVRKFKIDHFVRHSNVTAKVSRPSGPPLALRMRTGPAVSALTELTWLLAVRQGTKVRTVEPFSEDLPRNTVCVSLPGFPKPMECSLFLWADGEPLAAHLTVENYRQLGMLCAELHAFARSWTPPRGLAPLRWDRTLYYEGTKLTIGDPSCRRLIRPESVATVARVFAAADRELANVAGSRIPSTCTGISKCGTCWLMSVVCACWTSRMSCLVNPSRMSPSRCTMALSDPTTRVSAPHFRTDTPHFLNGRHRIPAW